MSLEDTIKLISNYMALPGAIEKIEGDRKASLNMPKASAGHPTLYNLFAEGEAYNEVYRSEPEKTAASPKLKKSQ